jgi:large subunit ribosomal protein L5
MKESVLKKYYSEVVASDLVKSHGYGNRHLVPYLEKVVVNAAISSDWDKNFIADVERDIGAICCQKPVIVKTKKSISNFKLRKGMPNGVKVTLRRRAMYDFFYKLVSIALPAVRDFRGVSGKLDGRGNYTLGIADHTIFPEVTVDKERRVVGMDVTFVTSAATDHEGRDLLRLLGIPFRKKNA